MSGVSNSRSGISRSVPTHVDIDLILLMGIHPARVSFALCASLSRDRSVVVFACVGRVSERTCSDDIFCGTMAELVSAKNKKSNGDSGDRIGNTKCSQVDVGYMGGLSGSDRAWPPRKKRFAGS
jgi:hypothetical protein